jgi:hypothetical protein
MIYDLAQPHYNHAPQFPGQPPNSVANAGGSWTRPIVWDDGDLDTESSAPELASKIPHSVAATMTLQLGAR